jgi:hypothetical protein
VGKPAFPEASASFDQAGDFSHDRLARRLVFLISREILPIARLDFKF